MPDTAINNARVMSELFAQEQEQRDVQNLLMGRRLSDKSREDEMAVAFVQRALLGMGEHTLDIGTYQDLYAKSCMILGMNDKGRCAVEDKAWASQKLGELFSLSMGEDKNTSLLTGEVCERLLSHMNDPENSPYPKHVVSALDSFLTPARKQVLVDRAKENAFEHPFEPNHIADIVEKHGLKTEPTPPAEDEPALSDQVFKQTNVLEMAQQADKDNQRHQLAEDLQTDAKMRLNQIFDAHPQLVDRTLVDKLKTFAESTVDKVIDPNHLSYPKESIFSETLAEMDINGRAKKTLLTYRRPILGGVSIEFDSPYTERDEDGKPVRPADATFDIAALKLRAEGVQFPHITSRFKDPDAAIMFMKNSVHALVQAGYNIDDISVGRNLRHAFENIKAEYAPVISIGEAPDEARISPDMIPEEKAAPGYHPQRETLPEEQVAAANQEINQKIKALADSQQDLERPIPDDQLKIEDLTYCMDVAAEVGDLSDNATWQELQATPGLAPGLADQVKRVHSYVGKLIDKANPEHPTHKPLGVRELEKLQHIGHERLLASFDHQRLGRSWISISEQAHALTADNQPMQEHAQLPDQSQPPEQSQDSGQPIEQGQQPMSPNIQGEPTNVDEGVADIPSLPEAGHPANMGDDQFGWMDTMEDRQEIDPSEYEDFMRQNEGGGMPMPNEQETMPPSPQDAPSQTSVHEGEPTNLVQQTDIPAQTDTPVQGVSLDDEKWKRIADIDWHKIEGQDLVDVVALFDDKKAKAEIKQHLPENGLDIMKLDALVENVGNVFCPFNSCEDIAKDGPEHQLLARAPAELLHEDQRAALAALSASTEQELNMDVEQPAPTADDEYSSARPRM
jgi:hypothetical protein